MRKIASYVRVSTKEAAKRKEGSLKAQVQRITMRIEEKNRYNDTKWGELVEIYKDEAMSGKNTDRPDFQRMVGDVASGRVNTVMVTELSRLSRSVLDFLSFMNFLKQHNADFISLQQDLDTSTPIGKMIMTIMIALYEFEREQTVERIKNNYWARSLRGLLNGGSPFLGYDRDPNKAGNLVINEPEANIVRWIFDTYINTGSISETVRKAKVEGLTNKKWVTKEGKSRGGNEFGISSIHYILTNHAYIGKKILNRENKREDQEKLKDMEKYLEIDAVWEPIVEKEKFEKVQKKLGNNRDEGFKAKNYDFYLTGLLYCDECGKPLVGKTGHGKKGLHFYYGHVKASSCQIQNYRAIDLEEHIRSEITALLNEESDLDYFIERLQETLSQGVKNIDSLLGTVKRQAEEAETKKRNLIDLISAKPEASLIQSLMDELKSLELKIAALEEKKEALKILRLQTVGSEADKDFVVEQISNFKGGRFDKATIHQKKETVRSLFKSIHIHPQNVIRLNVRTGNYQPKAAERSKATEPDTTAQARLTEALSLDSYKVGGKIIPFAQTALLSGAPPTSADLSAESATEGRDLEVGGSHGIQKNRAGGI